MKKINANAKFDIGDIAYAFLNKTITKVMINRINLKIERSNSMSKDSPGVISEDTMYFATPVSDEFRPIQERFSENQLFTKDELIKFVNAYFEAESEGDAEPTENQDTSDGKDASDDKR